MRVFRVNLNLARYSSFSHQSKVLVSSKFRCIAGPTAESESIANKPVDNESHETIEHVFQQDVGSVLRSHSPTFQKREPALHD